MKDPRFEHPVVLEALGFGMFLTVLGGAGSYLLSQSFSPALLSIALVFALAQLSIVVLFHLFNREGTGTRKKKSLQRALIASFLLLLLALIMGTRQWRKEAEGGTLVIYVGAGATSPPQHLKVHRGFPQLIAFLDHPRMVELDTVHKKFSLSDLRCGRWYVSPQPESEYQEIGPITIPAFEPRKAERRDSFEKRRCSFSLKTFDEAGALLEGATIQLKPTPRGLSRALITPEFLSLEVGIYEVAFSLPGYKDFAPIQRSCFPDTKEEIHIELVREAKSELVADSPDKGTASSQEDSKSRGERRTEQGDTAEKSVHTKANLEGVEGPGESRASAESKKNADHDSEPDAEVLEVVRKKELNRVSLEVENLLKRGDGKGAIERLKRFARKYPGTEEGREAERLIDQINPEVER